MFHPIFVPQGAEFAAVQQGLRQVDTRLTRSLVALPAGMTAVDEFFCKSLYTQSPGSLSPEKLSSESSSELSPEPLPPESSSSAPLDDTPFPVLPLTSQPLLLGLCGSLSPQLTIGQALIYQTCSRLTVQGDRRIFSPPVPLLPSGANVAIAPFAKRFSERFGEELCTVAGICVPRVVSTVTEKQAIATQYPPNTQPSEAQPNHTQPNAAQHAPSLPCVLDMESYAVWQHQPRIAVIRVVSDDLTGDIPNLAQAIDATGTLNPWALMGAFMAKPIAATRLIRGSLAGLQRLKAIAKLIGQHNQEQH